MITTLANSLVAAFNRAQPGSLPAMFLSIQLGTLIRQGFHFALRGVTPAVDPYGAASNSSIVLPDDAKAASISTAYARAGSGTLGPLAVAAAGSAPSAGQVAVAANGNILFNAADCLEEDQEYRVCLRTAAKLRRALGSSRSGDPDWSYIEGKPGPLVPPVRNGKLRLKFPRLKRRE